MPEKKNNLFKEHVEIAFSEEEYDLLRTMVLERTGIFLTSDKGKLLYGRMAKRLRKLGIANFSEYTKFLHSNKTEDENFTNLIANASTSFFRENEHFEYLKKVYLPALLAKKNRIRIWSACCSTGEEAYSIAIILHELLPNMSGYDIKILATDINTQNLAIAKAGVYPRSKLATLSNHRKFLYFSPIPETEEVKISIKLKNMITFNKLNLIDPWPMRGPFDVIFIRNTLMYFQKEIARNILKKINGLLESDGLLVVGHTESLRDFMENYVSIGNSMYRKL